MKFSYIFLIVIIGTSLFCSGCQHVFQKGRPFPSVNLDSHGRSYAGTTG